MPSTYFNQKLPVVVVINYSATSSSSYFYCSSMSSVFHGAYQNQNIFSSNLAIMLALRNFLMYLIYI